MDERIVTDPDIMEGQPCIRGTGLTVAHVLEVLRKHRSCLSILAEHPELDPDDIREAVDFASRRSGACHLV